MNWFDLVINQGYKITISKTRYTTGVFYARDGVLLCDNKDLGMEIPATWMTQRKFNKHINSMLKENFCINLEVSDNE